jgi:hypothetical protein
MWTVIRCQGVEILERIIARFACCFPDKNIMLRSPPFINLTSSFLPYFFLCFDSKWRFSYPKGIFIFSLECLLSSTRLNWMRRRKGAKASHSRSHPIIINVIMFSSDLNFCFQFLYFRLEVLLPSRNY